MTDIKPPMPLVTDANAFAAQAIATISPGANVLVAAMLANAADEQKPIENIGDWIINAAKTIAIPFVDVSDATKNLFEAAFEAGRVDVRTKGLNDTGAYPMLDVSTVNAVVLSVDGVGNITLSADGRTRLIGKATIVQVIAAGNTQTLLNLTPPPATPASPPAAPDPAAPAVAADTPETPPASPATPAADTPTGSAAT